MEKDIIGVTAEYNLRILNPNNGFPDVWTRRIEKRSLNGHSLIYIKVNKFDGYIENEFRLITGGF